MPKPQQLQCARRRADIKNFAVYRLDVALFQHAPHLRLELAHLLREARYHATLVVKPRGAQRVAVEVVCNDRGTIGRRAARAFWVGRILAELLRFVVEAGCDCRIKERLGDSAVMQRVAGDPMGHIIMRLWFDTQLHTAASHVRRDTITGWCPLKKRGELLSVSVEDTEQTHHLLRRVDLVAARWQVEGLETIDGGHTDLRNIALLERRVTQPSLHERLERVAVWRAPSIGHGGAQSIEGGALRH